ncbi:hypothetical protein JHK85_044119 [Glycine max]|nr:hypothetical protein JHK85_044119 [Glycine max]
MLLSSSNAHPIDILCLTPKIFPTKPRTLIVIHGYTGKSSWLLQLTTIHFAKIGLATCALNHRGHGFSDGLVAHIPDINPVINDCTTFENFRSRFDPLLPSFLYIKSLGGAITLLITLRRCEMLWSGVILNSTICRISAKFKPLWPLEHFLPIVATVIPTWCVVPMQL